MTDFGKPKFDGVCPPKGDKAHRYQLTLYALKDTVPLENDASAAMVGFYLSALTLEKKTIESLYKRQRCCKMLVPPCVFDSAQWVVPPKNSAT